MEPQASQRARYNMEFDYSEPVLGNSRLDHSSRIISEQDINIEVPSNHCIAVTKVTGLLSDVWFNFFQWMNFPKTAKELASTVALDYE